VWPGRKGRKVRGKIEGFAFRTTLVSYPHGKGAVLIVNRQMRAALRVRQGDKVRIWLEPDLEEREILVPKELKRELSSDRTLRKWLRSIERLHAARDWEMGRRAEEPGKPEKTRSEDGGAADAGYGGGTGATACAEGDLSSGSRGRGRRGLR
jgi:ribosomal 50S subunit-recycling heat shock protein